MTVDWDRTRVVIQGVTPQVDDGRFPIKRTTGEAVVVEADVLTDGHEALTCVLLYRRAAEREWSEVSMEPLVNDRWRGRFTVTAPGRYRYAVTVWRDPFRSWLRDLARRLDAGQDVSVDLLIGADLVETASRRAEGADADELGRWCAQLRAPGRARRRADRALDPALGQLMDRCPDRQTASTYDPGLEVVVDVERARFSTWYEMFPRSAAPELGRHGTFADCEARLPEIARMGFDVLYLPPIHPIGVAHRKGKNNSVVAAAGDVGSPWAIGSAEGGHKAVHPELGALEDFRSLVSRARALGIEVALDIAFQCSPDHPYVTEHPEWFRARPDGTIQYAENPPKKYEDIYPFDFDTEAWSSLWEELRSVVLFWIEQGVSIFRVDNPHTKPFALWEWLIGDVKARHPDVIFLAEAFTRPKAMYRLAALGFTQSYTYFAWRNTKWELSQYFTELTQTEVREFFRPNLWPNTPDILTEYLQTGGRPAFMSRLVLAATLGASYGVYGPAYEMCEADARELGGEEYLDSEKYQVRHWDTGSPDSLQAFMARVNRIRRENAALQGDWNLRFHPVDNEQILCYSKRAPDGSGMLVMVVNLDPHHTQSGWIELPVEDLDLDPSMSYQMHDLLTDARYLWSGPRNYVELDPSVVPAHIFRMHRRVRTERDFDYYL
jgi:starch synthase (maltosyl-transferring)